MRLAESMKRERPLALNSTVRCSGVLRNLIVNSDPPISFKLWTILTANPIFSGSRNDLTVLFISGSVKPTVSIVKRLKLKKMRGSRFNLIRPVNFTPNLNLGSEDPLVLGFDRWKTSL